MKLLSVAHSRVMELLSAAYSHAPCLLPTGVHWGHAGPALPAVETADDVGVSVGVRGPNVCRVGNRLDIAPSSMPDRIMRGSGGFGQSIC